MKYLSLLLLVSTIAAGAARADDRDEFSKNGVYFGIGASYGVPLFEPTLDNAFNDLGLDEKVSNAWGLNSRLGYRFHKYLAAEVEYEWLQHFGMRVGGASLGSVRAPDDHREPEGDCALRALAALRARRVRRDARQI